MSVYNSSKVKTDFPSLGFLVDDPEVGPILREYYEQDWDIKGEDGVKWLQHHLYETNWYRTRSTYARNILALEETDPGEYQRRLDLTGAQVNSLLTRLGAWVPDDQKRWITKRALAENLSEFEIRNMITMTPGWMTGQTSHVASQVKAAFSNYLVPFNKELNDAAIGNIINQQWTIDNLNEFLQFWAGNLYPHLKKELDSGLTMQQIVDPYRSLIARTLEIEPGSVDFTDPRFRNAIDFIDDKGEHRLMTLTETERFAMQQPEFTKTKGARDKAFDTATEMRKAMGEVA